MSLNKINIEKITQTIENIINSFPVFSNYKLIKCEVSDEKSPIKITNYDFLFTSELDNRWFFFRIQDCYNYQKLILWLNKLNDKNNVNFDIYAYFIKELDDKSIKQRIVLKVDSIEKLHDQLMNAMQYIVEKMDNNVKNVLLGTTWIDMEFNWGDYK